MNMNQHNNQSLNSIIIKCAGQEGLQLIRTWERGQEKIVRYKEHVTFNKKCLENKVIPHSLRVKSPDKIQDPINAANECSLKFLHNRVVDSKLFLKNLLSKNQIKLDQIETKFSLNCKYI